jgi:hypothetical protein
MSFARPSPEEQQERNAARRSANLKALATATLRPVSAGSYSGGVSGIAIEKEDASQSGPYMRAAKSLGYCMRCGVQVEPNKGLLDFCHADIGKGQGLKTDCRKGWPGCRACHEEVGRALPKPVRRAVEYLLGVMTRAAVLAAGTWPKRLPMLEEKL